MLREAERKKLIKEELDKQVEAKKQRACNLTVENQLYDEMHTEHGKLLAEREQEKIQTTKQKIHEDKLGRDQQLKEE
jgi:hypothetical protein